MANRIMLNETSYHGAGAIKEIATEAKARAFKKAFVCSDPDLIKFNVTTKVTKVLDDAGLEYELYSDIKPNPTIQNVQHGVEAFKKAEADYLIAIGGGSSMDTSKAIGIINKFRVNRHTITRNTHNFMLLISFRQLIICLLLSVRQQSTDNQRYTHYYLVHLNPLFAIHHLLLSSHLLTNTSQNDTTIYAQRKPLPFPRNHAHYPVTRSSRNSSLP